MMVSQSVKLIFVVAVAVQVIVLAVYLGFNNKLSLYVEGSKFSSLIPGGDSTVPWGTWIVPALVNSSAFTDNHEGPPATKSEVFQSIDDKQAWMYSAYYDHVAAQTGRPLVRLFGLILKNTSKVVLCIFTSGSTRFTTSANIIAFPDSHNKSYLPSHLECPVPSGVRPTRVSVSFQTKNEPTNQFEIIYPGPRVRNFTVCYSVLHSGFSKTTQLIESIEMNMMLGAEHFIVYNYSISPAVDQIIRLYQKDGLVTVLQWPLPTGQSWYFAQMAALNDCFYRNRNTSRFVVVVDTDEQFVFNNHSTFSELINFVSPHEMDSSQFVSSSTPSTNRRALTGCFLVRSSFFTNDWTPNWDVLPPQFPFSENEKKNIVKHRMLTLSQFWRQEFIFPFRDKSKYIARPELVHTCGIHLVFKFTSGKRCYNISENLSLLHHYRVPHKRKGLVMDTGALKFKQTLYPRIIEQMRKFPDIFK